MQKVLILGGSGLIGTAVANEMKRKYEVYPTYFQNMIPSQRSIRFDIEDPDSVHTILDIIKPDIAVSCLRGDFNKQLKVHRRTAEYLKASGGHMYFFSTSNVFDNDRSKPHDEDDPPESCTEYGRYKIECENNLKEILRERVCILRIPQVWGKDSPRMKRLKESLAGGEEIALYANLYRNTNTDMMIARQLCHIVRQDLRGTFHLAAEDVINNEEFYMALIEGLGFSAANIKEDSGEEGYFAIVSKRLCEFPEELRITNQMVIEYLIR